MAPAVPPAEVPDAHTSTQQWQSFEMRMRQRRIERLLLRADVAHEAGCPDDALEALAEAERLDASDPRIPALRARLTQPAGMSAVVAAAAAAVVPASATLEDLPLLPVQRAAVDTVPALDLIIEPSAPPARSSPLDPMEAFEPEATAVEAREPPKTSRRWLPAAAAAALLLGALGWFAAARPFPLPSLRTIAQSPAASPTQTVPAETPAPPQTPAQPQPAAESAALTPVQIAVQDVAAAPAASDPAAARPSERPADTAVPPFPTSPPASQAYLRGGPAPAPAPPPAPVALPEPPPVVAPPIEPATSLPATVPAPEPPASRSSAAAPEPVPEPAPPPSRSPAVTDEAGVRAVLARYESAYSSLDVKAAGAVWPALDRRALARAFDGLSAQRVSLGDCDVRVVGDAATAECTGSASWTPKVGGGTHNQSRRWQFRLRNAAGSWHITSTTVK